MKEKELNPVIYKTTNLVNGKIYVGQDRYNNPKYLGSGIALINSIKFHSKENFKKEILEHCALEDLNEREVYWIKELDSMNFEVGYNLNSGGKQNTCISEITKQKLRKSRETVVFTDETRDKMSKSAKSRGDSSLEGRLLYYKYLKENNLKLRPDYVVSDVTKSKMSKSSKGQVPWNKGIDMGIEFRVTCENAHKNVSDATKLKMSESRKKYLDIKYSRI